MKKIFVFLILFIISTFIFTSTVSANNLKYEYQLIGYVNNVSDSRITSITNLKLDVYSYNNNNIISNTTYEDTIYPNSNGKIYYNIDNNKNYFFKVDITTLPIGYGIENEDYYFDNDNLAIISLITIDHIICTDNNYEYYSSSNSKLISQYNSSLNSITTYNTIVEEDEFSLASSEVENTRSFDNTGYRLSSVHSVVGNTVNNVTVNYYYYNDGQDATIFNNYFQAFRSSYVNTYNFFCAKFNVTPYTAIRNSNYEIDVYFKLKDLYYDSTYEAEEFVLNYIFGLNTDYESDIFQLKIAHELAHAFIFEMANSHAVMDYEYYCSDIEGTTFNEGIAEFLCLYYNYISDDGQCYESVSDNVKSRIIEEYEKFFEYDNYYFTNQSSTYELSMNGFNIISTCFHLNKSKYSYFVIYSFLYEYWLNAYESEQYFFNYLKEMLLSIYTNYSINNSLSLLTNYLENLNDKYFVSKNWNTENYLIELNKYIFSIDSGNSLLSSTFDFLCNLDCTNDEIEKTITISNAYPIYVNIEYYNKKFSERYFYLHNHTETTFNQTTKYNLTLTYSYTMAVQAVYKTVDNEIFSSVVEYVPTANNTTSNIVINVPAQTECFLYVYYKTDDVDTLSTITFTSITSTMDVIDINNNELLSYGDTYNDFGVLRLLIENGNYNNTFVSNYNFTIKLLDYSNEEVYTYNPSISNNKYIYNLSNIPYNGTYFILLIPTTVNQLIYTNIYSTSITSSITLNGTNTLSNGTYTDNVVTSFTNLNTNMYKIMFNYPYNVNYCYNVTNSSNNVVYKYNDSIPGTTANYTYNDGIICMLGNTTYNINVTNTYSNSLNNYYMKLIMIDESSTLQSDQAMGKTFGNGVHEDVIKIEVEDSGTYRLICSYTGSITNDADVYLMVKDNNNVICILGFSLNDLNKTIYYDYYLPNNYDYYIVIDKELTNFDFYMEGVIRNA